MKTRHGKREMKQMFLIEGFYSSVVAVENDDESPNHRDFTNITSERA